MKNLIDLSGKTVIVTGASSGIGRQTAITLSEVGAKIVATARNEERLKDTITMLSGSGHSYYSFDLDNIEGIEGLLNEVVLKEGKVDGLAFCAGIDDTRPYKSLTPNVMERVMRTNFFSFYEMTRQFAKKKVSRDGSKIVVISSMASEKPDKGQAAYAASKAAIDAAIISLSKELMPRRININSVRPSWVRTPLIHDFITDSEKYHINMQPLGLIEPIDVAILVAYLLSQAADMITGRAMDIDGGALFS